LGKKISKQNETKKLFTKNSEMKKTFGLGNKQFVSETILSSSITIIEDTVKMFEVPPPPPCTIPKNHPYPPPSLPLLVNKLFKLAATTLTLTPKPYCDQSYSLLLITNHIAARELVISDIYI
jgi:hypothetical protein